MTEKDNLQEIVDNPYIQLKDVSFLSSATDVLVSFTDYNIPRDKMIELLSLLQVKYPNIKFFVFPDVLLIKEMESTDIGNIVVECTRILKERAPINGYEFAPYMPIKGVSDIVLTENTDDTK